MMNFARVRFLLSTLLAVLLYAECVRALRCYSCQTPTTASQCMTSVTCPVNDTICKTTMYSREDVYPFLGDSTVTRSCALQCVPSDVDGIGTTHPVTCCYTDLCNTDGAASAQTNCLLLGTSIASSFLLLRSQL